MAERDRQLDREVDTEVDTDVDIDALLDDDFGSGGALDSSGDGSDDAFGVEMPDDSTAESQSRGTGGLRERARARAGSILSKRGLVLSTVVALVGVLLLGAVLPFGTVGNLLGMFVAAFLYGTVATESQYVPMGLASGAVGGVTAALGNLTLTLLGPGVPIVAVGAVGGLVAGVLGHYFGRDLRDGLTRDI